MQRHHHNHHYTTNTLIYIHQQHCHANTPITILPETADTDQPVLVSCSAAISHRLINNFDDHALWRLLLQHGESSRLHQELPRGLKSHLNACMAVHLRHQATAGSGRQANLNRTIDKFMQNTALQDSPTWVYPYMEELCNLHRTCQ